MEKQSASTGEIILYNVNEKISLEVHLSQETVWLTQSQMAELYGCSTDNISLHLKNIYKECELEQNRTSEFFSEVRQEGTRKVLRQILYYNLDAILSVGYRVSSKNATLFRQWATKTLKEILLRGYAINYRIEHLEKTVAQHTEQIEFFVKHALPPQEGIFYNGNIPCLTIHCVCIKGI